MIMYRDTSQRLPVRFLPSRRHRTVWRTVVIGVRNFRACTSERESYFRAMDDPQIARDRRDRPWAGGL